MDGVLIDSEALHKSTKRQALRSAGIEVDAGTWESERGKAEIEVVIFIPFGSWCV